MDQWGFLCVHCYVGGCTKVSMAASHARPCRRKNPHPSSIQAPPARKSMTLPEVMACVGQCAWTGCSHCAPECSAPPCCLVAIRLRNYGSCMYATRSSERHAVVCREHPTYISSQFGTELWIQISLGHLCRLHCTLAQQE